MTFLTQTNQQYSLTQAIFRTLAIFYSSGHERRNGVIKRIGDDLRKPVLHYTSQFYMREPEADLAWVKKVTK